MWLAAVMNGFVALAFGAPELEAVPRDITGPDGKAVAEAVIHEVHPTADGDWQVTKSDLETWAKRGGDEKLGGAFSGSFLVIDSPGCALSIWQYGLPTDSIHLQPEFWLEGEVVDEGGSPVAGADVTVGRFGVSTYLHVYMNRVAEGLPWFRTTTDAQGRYRLRGAVIQGYSFDSGMEVLARAERDGATMMGWVVRSIAGDIEFYKEARNEPVHFGEGSLELRRCDGISGRVVDRVTGEAIKGAVLSHHGGIHHPLTIGSREVSSDHDGRFSLSGVRIGQLAIECPGYQSGRLVPQEDWRESGHFELLVAMRPRVDARVSLVDGHTGGAPVVPMSGSFQFSDPAGEGWALEVNRSCGSRSETTVGFDAQGVFVGKLPAGKIDFRCFMGDSERNDDPYSKSFQVDVSASGDSDFRFELERKPGVLFKVMQPKEVAPTSEAGDDWERVVVWLSALKSNRSRSATAGVSYSFCPVERWGDEVRVHVEIQQKQPNRKLMDSTFKADPETWPVLIDAVAMREAARDRQGAE